MANAKHKRKQSAPKLTVSTLPIEAGRNTESKLEILLTVGLLVTLGLIYSVPFYGHFVYFNSDFWSFWGEGRIWFSGTIPGSMKRGPFFPIITILVGKLFPGASPSCNLIGTEAFNAALLPSIMILFYFIAKEFVGRWAVIVAILAGINPWAVWGSSEPLVELTLTALLAATVLCMVRGSRWAYFFAMLASITRWDVAAVIPAVAILDIIRNRRWLKSISYALAAAIPLLICLIIIKMQLPPPGKEGANYLQVLTKQRNFQPLTDLNLYWKVVCSFINAPLLPPEEHDSFNGIVHLISSFVLAVTFVGGVVLAFLRRKWELIAVLIIAVPYAVVHSVYLYHLERFSFPFAWFVLLMSVYALASAWDWAKTKRPLIPLQYILPLVGAVVFAALAVQLSDTLSISAKYCHQVTALTWAAVIVVLAGLFVLALLRRIKFSPAWLCLPAFLIAAIISNNANVGFIMGDGLWQANFKTLGKWFAQNAKPDDIMLSTMPMHVSIYSGLPEKRFMHIGSIPPDKAPDFDSVVKECRKLGVTLIAWDSRLAGSPNDLYYKLWGLSRWNILGSPKPIIDSCKLVYVISEGTPKIAVYRIIDANSAR
jgi:hypothetical protein